ncbi:DUF6716 putative glycosyltransferase [Glutamicibacter sp. NPDC087344]|uniref:DUF6716 putative glycosyltransferase n=1 Tax=Glutamicibacter sp. NPDC087344 TaxID=3363994 RepID=UPI00382BF743
MNPSILAIADSDSYLKLAVTFLDRLGPSWDRRVALVRTPVMPTEEQIAAAFSGTNFDPRDLQFLTLHQLNSASIPEDIVFAAATGPVVAEAYSRILRSEPVNARRTALISALPGVAYPATAKGWNYRRAGDAFICHSHAEARDFSFMTEDHEGHQPTIMVSKLPFLHSAGFPPEPHKDIQKIVFAPQAKVPGAREEREAILLSLEQTARLNPGLEVTVKLRARAGEPQTHLEAFPYDQLHDDLQASGRLGQHSHLRFETGTMSSVLDRHSALVTVSSTAALESLDRGLPTMILADFGVNEQMINEVFRGSNILGSLDDLESLSFSAPTKAWLRENYFHRMDGSFQESLAILAQQAHHGRLSTDAEVLAFIKNQPMRHRLRTVLPTPVVRVLQKIRRLLNNGGQKNLRSTS